MEVRESRPPGARLREAPGGLVVSVLAVGLLVLASSGLVVEPAAGKKVGGGGFLAEFSTHIKHIVIVMMENHAYDNMYGVYCTATGPYCPMKGDGYPPHLCVPLYPGNRTGPCVRPFPFTQANDTFVHDMVHDYNSTNFSYDNGSMDGFYLAEKQGLNPFGYYNATTNPIYWDLAEEYGLGDHFFSSYPSYSLPNHWYLVAGQAPKAIQWQRIAPGIPRYARANETAYLDEANQTMSVEDLLVNGSVSWKYYDSPLLPSYTKAVRDAETQFGNGGAFNYWNPMAARAISYTQPYRSAFVNNSLFYANAASGHLPQLSIVIPHGNESDHPTFSHDRAQSWVASVVDAVEASPDWNTTALFLTFDEYGGFYDHEAPPTLNGQLLGFRVPLLVISPYTPEGVIGDRLGDFDSLLNLTEQRFLGGACLTVADCQAPFPFKPFFNFSMGPRAPIFFPTNISLAHYPMPLQNLTGGRAGDPSIPRPYVPPEEFLYYPGSEAYDVD